jgi:hypothetical protein
MLDSQAHEKKEKHGGNKRLFPARQLEHGL